MGICANELRIGNWVMYSSKIQVNENKIRECVDHPDRFVPIPLTEEWLERFGFLYNDKHCRFDSEMWNVRNRPEGKEISMNIWKATGSKDSGYWGVTLREELVFDDVTPVAIQYVHQLQNLYFALTGEELQTDETN